MKIGVNNKSKSQVKEISCNDVCRESYHHHVSVYRTPLNHLIRVTISVENCHHYATCEYLKEGEWKLLFNKMEVANYNSYQYTSCTVRVASEYMPRNEFHDNMGRILRHFQKVYASEI